MMRAPSTHYLLRIDSPESLSGIESAPSWVEQSLQSAPYVVVRRWKQCTTEIAVGVRGSSREERWASFIASSAMIESLSPSDLRISQLEDRNRLECIDALRHLQFLEQAWSELENRWGPGGSVGYELASGVNTCRPSSDLDIVVFAPEPISLHGAEQLLYSAKAISESIDIIVEAPQCGFSLKEFVQNGDNFVLRCADGPRLASNPWQNQPALW